MTQTTQETQLIKYSTKGTCCKEMHVEISGTTIKDTTFIGGCPGNLLAMKQLLKGMSIDEVIEKFKGIRCGDKSTSCADQLANCLIQYMAQR